MPLYEYYENATNHIPLDGADHAKAWGGTEKTIGELADRLASGQRMGLDGWYGVNWKSLIENLRQASAARGVQVNVINIYDVFISDQAIAEYQQQYETDDPSFGWVNSDGVIEDLMDPVKLKALRTDLEKAADDNAATVVFGPGSCVAALSDVYDQRVYVDFTMQPMLWKMWGGELIPFGKFDADPDYFWKRYYYCDFYLLYRQKKAAFADMDLFISAVNDDALVMLESPVYNKVIDELVQRPIKQVKILQPGPWGAYRYRDLWEVEGLECNAWNELAGIELSVLVDLGVDELLNIPTQNIMQRPEELVGEYVTETYPDLFPLQVWLDDGYFPEPVSYERSSMPIHDHPGTEYVKQHFNEPLGRYETYYIVESYPGSSTWMGYKEGADLEEWERLCKESQNLVKIEDWDQYVKRWDTNVGDLFLIPPGTTHGHGGNQMILEMDTGPSVAGTEYSFFTYDFNRLTWDDDAKTMTAPPMKMHTEHSFDNNRWVRESRVQTHHRARPLTIEGNGKYRKDQYSSLPEMPFHIERLYLEKEATNDTEGRFMHIATLTEGERVTVRSKGNPELQTTVNRLQACVIPASFGEYEVLNEEGGHAMIVILRLKKG